MIKRSWVLVLALGVLGGLTVEAQQRPISGRVVSALSGQPIAGARITVPGTVATAVTGADGSFALSAPAGEATIVARFIGYKRRQVTVPPGESNVQIALEEDVFNLEAVVVTGQATAVEQRNLANAITSVAAEQLNRAPTSTIETALQGKIPGALIQSNSGAPGGGVQISLRGVSTINGSVDPLIVMDGIVISNAAIANGMNAVSAAAAGGNASNQDNAVNRLADLNPGDVERVEVLKGASAAAIYGSKASNGVVIITTRRGRTGAPQFHLTQRLGQYRVSNLIGSRAFADTTEAFSVFAPVVPRDTATRTLIRGLCTLAQGRCPAYENERELWGRHDLSTETSLSLSGGTEQSTYYVSGLLHSDEGIGRGTGYQKQSIRANLGQRLSPRVNLSVGLNVVHSFSQRGISNNDNTGTSPYLVFPFTPSFVDLRPTGSTIADYPNNPFERSNPLQTFDFLVNDEDVWRALGTGSVTFDPITSEEHSLRFSLAGGVDYFAQKNDILSPPELEFEPQDGQPGTVVLGKASNLNLTLTGNVVHAFTPASRILTATTSAGFQYEDRELNITNITGRNLLTGQRNIDQATSITIAEDVQPVRDMGIFAQEEILALDQRLLVTFGVRADRSSRTGDPNEFFVFPKAAISYRFTGLGGEGDEVKLRAAWGQTGNQPLFGNKYTPDTTGTIGGRFGQFVGQRAGDPNIKPERQSEIELGADAVLLGGRASLNVTWFNKTITDLLLVQTLHPSSGQVDRIFNGGEMQNRGVEASAGYAILQQPNLSWIVRGTFFSYRPKIVDLPVPPFQVGGFGTSLGVFQIEEGRSATQILGSEGLVGDATPDFQVSFSTDVEYNAWSFGMLWEWKEGGDVINLTELLFDAGANSADWNTKGSQRWADFLSGLTQPYIQDASYMKLREATIAYRLPRALTAQLFGSVVENARISVSGRNLIRITDFRGIDPEVSNFGSQAIARNIDVAPFPPNRSLFLSIDLDF